MKYLPLVWRSLMRKKVRTLFTVQSITVAFILFCYLVAIGQAFSLGIDMTGQDRLLTIHSVSIIQALPLSHANRIRATEGVVDVTHATWFGGKYKDEFEGKFGIFPVVPEEYLAMYPEFLLPNDEKQAWFANRAGIIVGRKLADQYGWKVGDRIPLQGTIFHRKSGGMMWEFDLEGIYDGAEKGVDETQFLLHWEYFNEARDQGEDMVGWFIIRIDDPATTAALAKRIDLNFANSAYETETSTEKAFLQGFANQIGNIGAILRWVLTAVFFTILLVAGNTMAQSVRERTSELAVLKTLGFPDGLVLVLVLGESLFMASLGGLAGLGIGWTLVTVLGDPTNGGLPFFYVPANRIAIGIGVALALGLVTGLIPALRAMRLRITDALRRA